MTCPQTRASSQVRDRERDRSWPARDQERSDQGSASGSAASSSDQAVPEGPPKATSPLVSDRERGRSWSDRDQERRDQERGSVSVWLVTTAVIAMILVGIGVDLAGRVVALQHVRDAAAQAARAGGQAVAPGSVMEGGSAAADPAAAVAAAQSYLTAADVPGTATITAGGTRLVVATEDFYEPKILSLIGIPPMRVTGHGQARLVRVIDGSEH